MKLHRLLWLGIGCTVIILLYLMMTFWVAALGSIGFFNAEYIPRWYVQVEAKAILGMMILTLLGFPSVIFGSILTVIDHENKRLENLILTGKSELLQ